MKIHALLLAALVILAAPAFASVVDDARDACPPMPGEHFPSALAVLDVHGEPVNLDRRLAQAPSLVVLYRGGWCPYCQRHLAGLEELVEPLREMGVQVLAISPDLPGKAGEAIAALGGSLQLLSDGELAVAQALGLAFRLDASTLERYRGYGIDLAAASGKDHGLLPVPAAILVDRDRVIRFVYANPDYTQRVDPALLLQAARSLAAVTEVAD